MPKQPQCTQCALRMSNLTLAHSIQHLKHRITDESWSHGSKMDRLALHCVIVAYEHANLAQPDAVPVDRTLVGQAIFNAERLAQTLQMVLDGRR